MATKKPRYDYEAMKADFFTSPYKTINEYVREKLGKKSMSGSFARKVKGWTEEKNNFKEGAINDAIKESKENLKDSMRPLVKELEAKLSNILKLVDLKIKALYDNAFEIQYDKWGEIIYQTDAQGNYVTDAQGFRIPMRKLSPNISASEIARLYEMVKTEL